MKVDTILDNIDLGAMALPEFQRGYVWNRDQVRNLMLSLYNRHPVGSLLVWVTKTEGAPSRGDQKLQPGFVELLLDGQQRITSLYGIVRGRPPRFFDGNAAAFTDLYFNLETESFEFYGPVRMKGDPRWISITELMQKDLAPFIDGIYSDESLRPSASEYIKRLNTLSGIKDIDLHIEQVSGEDKTVDVVVDIFNRVNSGGTKLSKGDLALAKICAEWPEARDEMKRRLSKWQAAGYYFRLELLLRCINTMTTGEALFSALERVSVAEFRGGLNEAERSIDFLLNLIASRLGLDHDRVLGSRYSIPLLCRYLSQRGGRLSDPTERDRLLYWYIHSFLWGRYAVSTESALNQDLGLIEDNDGALDRLIAQLHQNRGDLTLRPIDFYGWSMGARFYPLLYMLTRVHHAVDWETGVELRDSLLGRLSGLQLHHIFPKAMLYKHGYSRAEVNALANFTFLTQETNLRVSDRDPAIYLAEFAVRHPGAIESHWIPMDPELWKIENYPTFLAARRELLAQAGNEFLDSLRGGQLPEAVVVPSVLDGAFAAALGSIESEAEERDILDCAEWVTDQGLPEGEIMYELSDPETGAALAVFDLAWPDGLQPGLSSPVTLLIDEPTDVFEAASRAGYRAFSSVDEFTQYVLHEILALHEDVAAD